MSSRTAPASEERQQQLEEEREMMNKMKPYKRKLYLLQREAVSVCVCMCVCVRVCVRVCVCVSC